MKNVPKLAIVVAFVNIYPIVMQKLYPPLPGGMKFANPPYCKFHTPQGYKICKKNFNKLR